MGWAPAAGSTREAGGQAGGGGGCPLCGAGWHARDCVHLKVQPRRVSAHLDQDIKPGWLVQRVDSTCPSRGGRRASLAPAWRHAGPTWLSGATRSSFPTSWPSGAVKLRKVEATNTPPGRSTREISASAACGLGQQWMAAPACIAATAGGGGGGREVEG